MNPVTHAKRIGMPASLMLLVTLAAMVAVVGCSDGVDQIRAIERQRQERVQSGTKVDHLGEMHGLLSRLVELNPQESQREMIYHLNR